MKNRGSTDRIHSLIKTLHQIHISSAEALTELHKIKHKLSSHRREEQDTKQEPQDSTETPSMESLNQNDTSPNTLIRNTGMASPPQHIDSNGRGIKVGHTVQILNTGLFRGNTGVVTKLGKARVSIKLTLGRIINQKSTNLEVTDAHV